MSPVRLACLTVLISACSGAADPPLPPLEDRPCDIAEERLDERVCVHTLASVEEWDGVALPSNIIDRAANSKWLAPATPEAYLQDALILDMNAFTLHWEMLAAAFPDAFPGLTHAEYSRMVIDPVNREYFSGDVIEFDDRGSTVFGFTIWDDPTDPRSILSVSQVEILYNTMAERVAMRPLVWVPNSRLQREAAATWDDPSFPIRTLGDDIRYEAYTEGTGIGTVRLYDNAALAQATRDASFSYQDLLVLDEAPFDIERPIAGAITGTRQGDLSHLNIRSANRGTPNCFVRDPLQALAPWEGQLVALTCGARGYTVRTATLDEAETFWQDIRPEPVAVPAPNSAYAEPTLLDDVLMQTAQDRRASVSTFGSKGANLAMLYQRTSHDIQLTGFVVPFHWYLAFIEREGWTVDLGDGPSTHTFAETLDAWHSDPSFLADARVRRQRLADLRRAIRDAPIDPVLVTEVADLIEQVWGTDDIMVRFRSSSNAEDSLAFNGAGLYDSTSACLADSRDSDADGPSHCDPDQDSERTLERAIGKVWASTYNVEAWEERDWYSIDPANVAMGILVNTRSKDEQANIVAFTGNPTADDDRTLINAQFGEWDVVSANPGVAPEKVFVTLDSGGITTDIQRVRQSSMGSGQVLTDSQIEDVAETLFDIESRWPIDEPVPADRTVLLDTEWKVLEDGRLIIKQIRPFLR